MSGTRDPWAAFEEVSPPSAPAARGGDPWSAFEPVENAPRQRSLGEEAGRQLGLTVRAGVEGVTALPGLLVDAARAPGYLAGRALGVETGPFRSTGEAISDALTRAGVPKPEGTVENLVGAAASGLAGGVAPAAPARVGADGAMRLGEAAVRSLSGASVPGAALAAGAGVAGHAAASAAPEGWEALAGTAGGLGAVGGAVGAVAGARAARRAAGRYLEPIGVGRRNALAPDLPAVTQGQVRQAVERLDAAASDPAAVRAAVADPPAELVPGSRPTLAQATEDPGLGSLGRGISRGPRQADFLVRQSDQRTAQREAVEGLAPDDADVTAPGQSLRARLAALDAANAADVERARGEFRTRLEAAGGNPVAGDDGSALGAYGDRLRAPLIEARDAARARERTLWDAVDPDGSLVADVTPIRDAARATLRDQPATARPFDGELGAIFGAARAFPDALPFRDVTALRSRITDGLRDARRTGDAQTVRHLSGLLGSLDDALEGTAARAAPPASSLSPRPADTSAQPSTGSAAFTPSGRRVDVRYRLAEADDLVASHDRDMRPNPAFPSELQPRDRTRAASEAQVQRIAGDLQPERLGASASAGEGAPIIGADGVVESGNARVLGLRRAFDANGPQAAAYRDWLVAQGYDPARFRRPVLVRERVTPLDGAERARFTEEANASPGLAMSATERAAQDAGRLDDGVLALWRGGDVADPANRGFARAFLNATADGGGAGAFAAADGSLSLEGARRIRDALTARAYGDAPFVAAMAEAGDATLRPFGGAMQDAAGSLARVQGAIARGDLARDLDLAPSLLEAARIVGGARRAGVSIGEALGQADAFAPPDPVAERLVRLAYGDEATGARMSREGFADTLAAYADGALAEAGQGSLFGGGRTAADLLEEAAARVAREAGEARPVPSPALPAPAAATVGEAGARSVVEGAALVPNFTADAAGRYAAARQATRERYATYRDAPGVGTVMREGPFAGEFRVPDSRVAGEVFRPGAGAADRVRSYLGAGGDPVAIEDYAAFSLRRAAERDGSVDQAAYRRWLARHDEALAALPELRSRLDTLGEAARTLAEAQGRRTLEREAFEASAASRFLGDADPVTAMGRLLRAANAQAQVRQLVAVTAGDRAAQEGLRRAVVDHVLRDLTDTTRAAGMEESPLRAAAFQRFLRRAEPALGELFSPRQIKTMRNVAADVERATLDTRVGTDSTTVQNAAAGGTVGALVARARGWAPGIGGSSIGFLYGDWKIASAGAAAALVHGMRVSGLRTVDDLVARAMLDPGVARLLFQNVTPRETGPLLHRLAERLVRGARAGAAGAGEDDRSPQPLRQRRADVVPDRANALLASAPPTPERPERPERPLNRLLAA